MKVKERIRKTLINKGSTSDIEALIKYGIFPKELNKICLELRKEGYYIKKYRNIITFTYLLINLDKN
tara:strand:+ start:42 stop:242 length:201 start_codon:yes stop_codon:yes gene_type:complete